jgi:hypothetical protein
MAITKLKEKCCFIRRNSPLFHIYNANIALLKKTPKKGLSFIRTGTQRFREFTLYDLLPQRF